MELQKNWTRETEETKNTQQIEDPDCHIKYYEEFEQYSGEFKGQYFKSKVLYAYVTYQTITTKTDKKILCEVLHLMCQLGDSNEYVEIRIWGRRRNFDDATQTWSEFSQNPNKLQDFLYLASLQKKNISDHYDFSTSYEDREVYPHICGTRLIVVAVTKEQKTSSKGRIYNNNLFTIFNHDFRSALEIQEKNDSKADIKLVMNEYKGIYRDYIGEDAELTPMQEVKKQLEVAETEVVKVDADDFANAKPQENKPLTDDDLPF